MVFSSFMFSEPTLTLRTCGSAIRWRSSGRRRKVGLVSVRGEPLDNAPVALYGAQMTRQVSLVPERFESLRNLGNRAPLPRCQSTGRDCPEYPVAIRRNEWSQSLRN